jgi:thiol-disulfide isomerase/thioredoxin
MFVRTDRASAAALVATMLVVFGLLAGCNQAVTSSSGKPPAANIRGSDDAKEGQESSQDNSAATAKSGSRKASADTIEPLPNGSDELLAYIRKLTTRQPQGETEDELRADLSKMLNSIIKAADKLLAAKELDEDDRLEAIQYKWKCYLMLSQIDEPGAEEEFLKLTNELAKDKNPALAKAARMFLRQREVSMGINDLALGNSKSPDKLLSNLQLILGDGDLGDAEHEIVQRAGAALEVTGHYDAAGKLYAAMKDAFQQADDPQVVAAALDTAERGATRLGWIGKPADFSGTQFDGQPFEFSQFKGKVVLLDFWATWCGICVAEMPNVQENFEKYRDKGFEVVGISLDENKDELESFLASKKLPWPTLWSAEAASEGTEDPLAKKFGVRGLPATFLIDQKGKVVAVSVRGERLGERLAELLGPADEGKADKAGE